jgi:hypothetical protein
VPISDIELQLRNRSIASKRLHSIPRDRIVDRRQALIRRYEQLAILGGTHARCRSRKARRFDKWYQNDFWPGVPKSFGVKKAWRFWSLSDPAIHQAT